MTGHEHNWRDSDIVVDTYPPIYHRYCECGRVESRGMGNDEWRECFESKGPYSERNPSTPDPTNPESGE